MQGVPQALAGGAPTYWKLYSPDGPAFGRASATSPLVPCWVLSIALDSAIHLLACQEGMCLPVLNPILSGPEYDQ